MPFDFDIPHDRVGTGCSKWSAYPPGVLPMWVADMDFAVAPAIVEALRRRVAHPIYGYAVAEDALREQIVGDMLKHYRWAIAPDDIVFLPGVEPGFNMALRAVTNPGDGVTVFVPVYKPMLAAPEHWGLRRFEEVLRPDGGVDLDSFRRSIAQSTAFLFCNPHNPVGKVFSRAEIMDLAEACLSAGAVFISDEIHCDLVYDGRAHIPAATLGPEIAANCITLMAASKTYNIAGLKCGFAIITNPRLRERFVASRLGMVDSVNVMGLAATRAAFAEAGDWKRALVAYLQANRDWLFAAVRERLPGIAMRKPEATFLAWLDCSRLGLDRDPYDFFLDEAKIGFSRGTDFGAPGSGHVRLNFGCPRATLEEALGRMERSLADYYDRRPHS
jgi:cysteine-S-conjugate beta-lyase